MRERRSTVRVECFLPAQYLPPETSLASTGRITDLSVAGLRLLTSQPLEEGKRVTVNLTLPNDEEPVSINGRVRWNGPASSKADGRPVGIEFEQLDETTRFCLQAFVADQTSQRRGDGRVGRAAYWFQEGLAVRLLKVGWPLLIALVSAGLGVWILQLQRQKEELRQTLAERTTVISQLAAHQQQLTQDLDQSRAAASLTMEELRRLQDERARLETQVGWLSQNLGELKEAYVRVRTERDALKNSMLALEQEQQALYQRLTSIPELRKAIRQASQVEAQQRREQRRQWFERLREADQQALQRGNRGYLIHDGRPTLTASRLSIHVHTPESTP